MAYSMTGYGRGESEIAGKKFIVEIKSVNHRFLEIVTRYPKQLASLEDVVKRHIQKQLSRGRLDVYITMEDSGKAEPHIEVDKGLAIAYYKAMKELAASIPEAQFDFGQIIKYPDVLVHVENEVLPEELWSGLEQAVNTALEGLLSMRKAEGDRLVKDLLERGEEIARMAKDIEDRAPEVVKEYRERLDKRLRDILKDVAIDEQRLVTEVAIFADRSSITEELVRLASHLEQLKEILASPEPAGRKLDFLVQELNREVNTIGSKANDLRITQVVVNLKSEIEKIKEQVQNIE